MKKTAMMWTAAAVLALTGGLFAYELAFASGARADCPGRIVCPLTGALVCADQCPLGPDKAREDAAPTCCARGR
ncbi:MAG: hypothetical protein HY722_07635 [Planctomycetes bacterium]|nr:hypothetical protein [Planctomycetota bacterium]